MGTEISTFWPFEPEKIRFKDGNPSFKIMTEPNTFSFIVIQFFFSHKLLMFASNCYVLAKLLDFRLWIDARNYIGKVQGYPSINKSINQLRAEESSFCRYFKRRVVDFKPNFLRLQWSKCKNFSAHQKENCM